MLQQFFYLSADLGNRQADDDLDRFALDHCTVSADGLEICIGLNDADVLDIDTQTGRAVGHVYDVILAAQTFEDLSSQFLLAISSGAALISSLLVAVLLLGVELNTLVIFTTGSLEVELDDEEAEDQEPYQRTNETDDQHEQVLP